MAGVPLPRGRRVEPDPTLVEPVPAHHGAVRVEDDGRTLAVGFSRGVWQRLRAVEVRQTPERVEVTVSLGITPELAAEMKRRQMFFTMQAIVEHTVVRLDEPLGDRELVMALGPPARSE